MPRIGEKKNCMSAQVVTNKPMYFEARAMSPCRKSEMSRGSTGAMMPKASMSSRTVTKMKPRAARRLVSMRSLLGERKGEATHTGRSEEHTSELQSRQYLVCRLLLEKKK